MIPFNSNKTGGCDNVSSNCVVWQGPDLPCIDLCHGDTISNVIAKLCEELVELSKSPGSGHNTMNMVRIDQSGLQNKDGQSAQEVNNQTELTNLIIENVVQARQLNQSEFGTQDVLNTPVSLPEVLQYQDPNTASIVRALPLQQYATLLGTRIVETTNSINTLQGQVANHEGRIISLENSEKRNKTNPTEKQILTTCVGNPGRLTNLSTALTEVERAFCGLQAGTGPQADLAASIGYQGASMASAKRLNGPGTLSTYNGFVNSPSSLAQSFTNAWIVINDMRAALDSLIADVIPTACSDIIYGFFANADGNPGETTSLNLNFSSSTIPSSFYDCDRSQGSKITVTDSFGSSQIFHKQIHQLQNSETGTSVAISSLNGASDSFEVKVQYCFTNGQGVECANTMVKNVLSNNICPTLTLGTPGLTSVSWTVNAQYLGAQYTTEIQLLNSKGSVIASQVRSNAGSAWVGSFTNLSEGASYIIQIRYGLTQENTFEHTCPQQSFITQGTTCTDSKILYATYKTTPADLQYSTAGSFTTLLCDDVRNPGTNMGDIYIAGYTSADNTVAGVLRDNTIWAETLTPCAVGKINANGVSIDYNNTAKSLVTNSVTTAVLATATTLGDGWRYVDAITSSAGKPLYVYVEVDTNGAASANLVPQVYFSCVGDEVNISQQGWTQYCPTSTAETSFSTNYNYQIAHGNSVSSSALSYDITAASRGAITFTPNAIVGQTQQFTYAPVADGTFLGDSSTTKLTIGSKNSGNYTNSFTRGFYPTHMNTDVVVFIDTDAYTVAEGTAIKTAMTAVHNDISLTCGNYTGNLYILPVNNCGFDNAKMPDGSASAYLSHHKIIALRGDGTTLTATSTWPAVAQTYTSTSSPVGWWGNTATTLAEHVMIFSFTRQADTCTCSETTTDLYTTTTAAAAPNAPTTRYKADYDDSMNILVDNNRNTAGDAGTFKGPSTWAALGGVALNTAYTTLTNAIFRLDGHYVISKEDDATAGYHDGGDGTDKALIRQMILAINAAVNASTPALTTNQYNAYRFGADYLNVEGITNWKANLDTNVNPYNASVTTANSNALAPLSDLNIQVIPYMDKYFPFAGNLNDPFTSELKKLTCVAQASAAGVCPVVGTSQVMGGTAKYGVSDIGTNTSASACTNAATSATAVYNSTGTQFDGSVRAYTTSAGAIDKDYRTELIHGRWYARQDGSPGKATAQYSRTYPYWTNLGTCV